MENLIARTKRRISELENLKEPHEERVANGMGDYRRTNDEPTSAFWVKYLTKSIDLNELILLKLM